MSEILSKIINAIAEAPFQKTDDDQEIFDLTLQDKPFSAGGSLQFLRRNGEFNRTYFISLVNSAYMRTVDDDYGGQKYE